MLAIFVKLERLVLGDKFPPKWGVVMFDYNRSSHPYQLPYVIINVRDDLRASMAQHIANNILESSVRFEPQNLSSTTINRSVSWGEDPFTCAKVTLMPHYITTDVESEHTFRCIGGVTIDEDEVPIIVMHQIDDKEGVGRIDAVIDFKGVERTPILEYDAHTVKYAHSPEREDLPNHLGHNPSDPKTNEIVDKIADFMQSLPVDFN